MEIKKKMARIILTLVAAALLMLVLVTMLMGSGVAPAAYNLIQNNMVSVTRRSTLNFPNGGCVDDAGNLSTDCTFLTVVPTNATCTFTNQTSVACNHNLGTTAITFDVYDASSPPLYILPKSAALTNTNTLTVTFASSQSGTIVVNGSTGSGAGGLALYSQSFATITSVVLTDNLGTVNKATQCYDSSTPPNLIIPQNVAITDSNNTTVTFSSSQSGKCFVIGP